MNITEVKEILKQHLDWSDTHLSIATADAVAFSWENNREFRSPEELVQYAIKLKQDPQNPLQLSRC